MALLLAYIYQAPDMVIAEMVMVEDMLLLHLRMNRAHWHVQQHLPVYHQVRVTANKIIMLLKMGPIIPIGPRQAFPL